MTTLQTLLNYLTKNPNDVIQMQQLFPIIQYLQEHSGTVINGTGSPAQSLGDEGQYYFDTTTPALYKKILGAWVLLITFGSGGSINIYNTDGTLTANRVLTGSAFSLLMSGLSSFGVSATGAVSLSSSAGAISILGTTATTIGTVGGGADIVLAEVAKRTRFINDSSNIDFDANGNILANVIISNDGGGNTIVNSICENCIIDFNGNSGITIDGCVFNSGSNILFNGTFTVEKAYIGGNSSLTVNGSIRSIIVGNGSSLQSSSGGSTKGVVVTPSSSDNQINVDLILSTDCFDNIYEITHTSSSDEMQLAFRKETTIWNLFNNSGAISPQLIVDATNYPSMYIVNLYANVNNADLSGGIITFSIQFTDFSGQARDISIGSINLIDQTTNPVLSISTPIYATSTVTVTVSGSAGSASFDIQTSTVKLN